MLRSNFCAGPAQKEFDFAVNGLAVCFQTVKDGIIFGLDGVVGRQILNVPAIAVALTPAWQSEPVAGIWCDIQLYL